MKKNFTLLWCLVIISFSATAQSIQWQKLLGGVNRDDLNPFKTQQTADGGYIVTGRTNSSNTGTLTGVTNNGGYDSWVIKLNASGNTTWQKLLGGSFDDQFYAIQQTSDGGYIATGEAVATNSGTVTGITGYGTLDAWIVKLDASGNIVWQKLLGGSSDDHTYGIQQTSDGGYIVAGQTNSSNTGTLTGFTYHGGFYDGWVIKLDASGNTTWQNLLGGIDTDAFREVRQTTDGGYITAGYSNSTNSGTLTGLITNGDYDGWIVKLDALGNTTWQKLLGGDNTEYLTPIQQTADGGYITALASRSSNTGTLTGFSNNGGFDGWVIKLDGSGNTTWQKLLGGGNDEFLYGCRQTSDGGYILSGYSNSSNSGTLTGVITHGANDGWIVKLNATGTTQSQQLLGGDGDDRLYTVQPTADFGYILIGNSGSNSGTGTFTGLTNNGDFDGWVLKLTQFTLPISLGDFTAKKLNDNTVQLDWFTMTEQNNRGFYIERSSGNSNSFSDIVFVKSKALAGNSSSRLNYTYTDVNNYDRPSYYRLKQIDADGKFSYSKIIRIDFSEKIIVQVYPNPASDKIYVEGIYNYQYIRISDISGKIVYEQKVSQSSGTINISNLQKGVYIIRLTGSDDVQSLKFLKK